MLKKILEIASGTLKINNPIVIECPPDLEESANKITILTSYRPGNGLVDLSLYDWLKLNIPYRTISAQRSIDGYIRIHDFIFNTAEKKYKCISDLVEETKLSYDLKTYFKYIPNVKK